MSGIQRKWVQHGEEGATLVSQQNCGAIVDYCKARHNEGFHGSADFKLKMVLPNVVVEHYCNVNQITLREFLGNDEHVKRLFNDPNFADLRIAPGAM